MAPPKGCPALAWSGTAVLAAPACKEHMRSACKLKGYTHRKVPTNLRPLMVSSAANSALARMAASICGMVALGLCSSATFHSDVPTTGVSSMPAARNHGGACLDGCTSTSKAACVASTHL